MHLRVAPVGTTGNPTSTAKGVVRAGTRCRRAGRIVVGNLLWSHGIADVEHADAGIKVTTSQRRGILPVVHAAVVAAIAKRRQAHKVGEDEGTGFGRVCF